MGHDGLKLLHDRLHPLPVHAQVRMTRSRRRAKMNHASLTVDEELDIIDEAKQRAGELGVKVMLVGRDDLTAWHLQYDLLQHGQRGGHVNCQRDRVDPLMLAIRLCRDAIGRVGTRGQSTVANT